MTRDRMIPPFPIVRCRSLGSADKQLREDDDQAPPRIPRKIIGPGQDNGKLPGGIGSDHPSSLHGEQVFITRLVRRPRRPRRRRSSPLMQRRERQLLLTGLGYHIRRGGLNLRQGYRGHVQANFMGPAHRPHGVLIMPVILQRRRTGPVREGRGEHVVRTGYGRSPGARQDHHGHPRMPRGPLCGWHDACDGPSMSSSGLCHCGLGTVDGERATRGSR